jgi:RecA/RadA recombinase
MKNKDLKDKLIKKKRRKKLTPASFLSSGSTLLNLACSGKYYGAFIKGKYYYLVGDSSSGKTFLSLTCLAEASINPNFDKYRFIHDDVEGGALMSIEKFFGKEVARRIEPPAWENGEPVSSSTIEDAYYNIDDALNEGKPFIYILDSMDGLSSKAEQDKFEETKKAHRKGKTTAGSYGDGKAKKNSTNLRKLLKPLRQSGSILILISQTRDNLGIGFNKKSRSGGHALTFYACLEIWSSIGERITKIVKGKTRQLGISCVCRVKKNRIQGKDRKIKMPIYHSFGIDDVGSCIDYLLDEGHWKQRGNMIIAPEFKMKCTKEKLIRYIGIKELEKDLRMIVSDVWHEIEEACAVKRKRRYE